MDEKMALASVEWIITEPVMVTEVTDAPDYGCASRVLVRSLTDAAGSYRQCELRYELDSLTFNTVFVDVGDDLVAYLAVMDAAGEAAPGTWVRSEPYDGDEGRAERAEDLMVDES